MKIAIPLVNGAVSQHFGHCEEFVFVTVAVLLALIPLVQSGLTPLPDPDPMLLTVTVVLPLFTIPDAVNVPLPAVLTVMVAVLLLAELSPLRL